MADDTQRRKQAIGGRAPRSAPEALAAGLQNADFAAMQRSLSSITAAFNAGLAGGTSTTQRGQQQERDLAPAVVGGEEEKKTAKPRTRRGRVTTRGRHRVMNHWEIFDSELNELGGLQQDALRSFALAGFFVALALDVVRDVLTSDMTTAEHAIWVTLAFAFGVLGCWNYLQGRYARRRGATRLQQIKDEHDED